jgi:hypothetical protein
MSLSEIRNVVLLFSNPVWSGANTVPTTIVRNITALSSQIAYAARLSSNLTTLSTSNVDPDHGAISGLLYVPTLDSVECASEQYAFIPRNVTRRANLPPTNYNLIAIAPWFNVQCTQAYLAAARRDPVRAFVFYKPNNSSNKPQDVDSPVWDLDDNRAWTRQNRFPIFAIPGIDGLKTMNQLSLYSGDIDEIPHADDISALYEPHESDYVRIWSELTLEPHEGGPVIWTFVLIILGALLGIFAATSFTMHFVQRRRRKSLERRVKSGEVDLEAMGVKRLNVPASHVASFPVFTYSSEPDITSAPPTPGSPGAVMSSRSARSSRRNRRHDTHSVAAESIGRNSIRSKRSSLAGAGDNTATNHQPDCHICLDRFEHCVTIIRQLPCGHIYHPVCIDEFLTQNSSLCPLCKQCMLPQNYSPKITNSMVRRERAVRRLRERVTLDDSYFDEEAKIQISWTDRIFHTSTSKAADSSRIPTNQVSAATTNTPNAEDEIAHEPSTPPITQPTPGSDNGPRAPTEQPPSPGPAVAASPRKQSRPRRKRSMPPNLLPTQPENAELQTPRSPGRKSPTLFARQRMREMAARNAPLEDEDSNYPLWRRTIAKVFPGF